MSPAELPDTPLAEIGDENSETAAAAPSAAASPSPAPQQDPEIERLQLRLDELKTRINSALPEGYDLRALVDAAGEGHESEEVFEITSEIDALERLAGPLMVPGATPPPAFATEPAASGAELPSAAQSGRWRLYVLAVIFIAVIIGGVATIISYV